MASHHEDHDVPSKNSVKNKSSKLSALLSCTLQYNKSVREWEGIIEEDTHYGSGASNIPQDITSKAGYHSKLEDSDLELDVIAW